MGEAPPAETTWAAWALPKLSFHLEGFLLTTEEPLPTEGPVEVDCATETEDCEANAGGSDCRVPLTSGAGSQRETGSLETGLRLDFVEADVDVVVAEVRDTLEALLTSLASDSDAAANSTSVSEDGIGGAPPLPLRAPRLRRLVFEVDLDAMLMESSTLSWSSSSSTS